MAPTRNIALQQLTWTHPDTAGYDQLSGKLYARFHGRDLMVACYSGHGAGYNNPAMEDVKNVGPIPAGFYRIEDWEDHPRLGPCVCHLVPMCETTGLDLKDIHGRSGFFLHGDSQHMNHTASDGCIVANLATREAIRTAGIKFVRVV